MLVFTLVVFFFTAILHFAIAILVGLDAGRLKSDEIPPGIAPWIWVLASLLGGIFVLGLYWVVYYSSLRKPSDSDS